MINSNLTNISLAAINLAKLTDYLVVNRNDILDSQIKACIVALGSNFKADKHLAIARDELEKLALVKQWSTPFVNADYTATTTQPKPDYSNQCGYLTLVSAPTLQQLVATTKGIEQQCQRLTAAKNTNDIQNIKSNQTKSNQIKSNPIMVNQKQGRVSIDIDILAVQIAGQWQIIKQRYPFKDHERIGVNELLSHLEFDKR